MSNEQSGEPAGPDPGSPAAGVPVRVFISYAHDDPAHEDRVREFWLFLRQSGIDARLDLPAAERRQDWAEWMTQEILDAQHVLVIASPEYKRRAEGHAGPDEGRGVQWEAGMIRERIYRDQKAGLQWALPVVLPDCSADDIPEWLRPTSTSHYLVSEFTETGADKLLRLLTGQPWETVPPLGTPPVLRPRDTAPAAAVAAARRSLHTEVLIEADVTEDGQLASTVWLAGAQLCQRQVPLPFEVARIWNALRLPALDAAERMVDAGRRLAATLLDDDAQRLLANMLDRLPPGDTVEVVLSAGGPALSLPVELIRLTADAGEVGPLALLSAVSVSRRPAKSDRNPHDGPGASSASSGAATAGPLKVLAAVAAPDETKTQNSPLDVEAEMQAVLDAVTIVADHPDAQVRILEVASLPAIRQALRDDAYHVLHLSAHGSPDSIELEDEDGAPVAVTSRSLMEALRHAGRAVPLIVLSSCSGGSTGSEAIAAGLITQGAERVIAMLAPVSDDYATTLARYLYRELSAQPESIVGQALARARYLAEEERSRTAGGHLPMPEYGVATLLAADGDAPLVDPTAQARPLARTTVPPGGKSVRELSMGALIGRRAQLRTTMGVLRRTSEAMQHYGVASGVQLTGIGGIGKTAVAGRVISRLRADGWLIAVHEGRWNPAELISATARTINEALPRMDDAAQAHALQGVLDNLTDPRSDDGPKLATVTGLLASHRLLLVFDDFEQNLTPGGQAFLDPAIDQVITGLADTTGTGALLLTCRYPLPGPDRFLVEAPIPPLSAAELRRMFLRMPALAELEADDRRLLARTIGGHPRLIEFVDALLRGGRSNLKDVQIKLRDLAWAQGVDLSRAPSMTDTLDRAMVLGGADILLTELIRLLTAEQTAVLMQVAVCRAPMSINDLAFALDCDPSSADAELLAVVKDRPDLDLLQTSVNFLTDMTLLAPGDGIVMHPWTADLVTRNAEADLTTQHERALVMRFHRFEQQRGSYEDLIDIPRHLACLGRYDEIPPIAEQATRILPGTLATVAYLAEVRPLIPLAERARFLVADLEVQALLRSGDLPAAARQLAASHQQVAARAITNPANTEWQRDLSVSHIKLGDIATAAGDLTAARAAYQASLDIRTRLAAADPTNTGWQRDLSISHNKLGDIATAAGDPAAARAAYQADLDIAARLAAADPANTGWQRDLCVSHIKLGEIATAVGDLTAARTHYQASLDIAARLTGADPANTEWQRDLSVSHNKLGDIAAAAGDLTAARTAYQASLDIRTRLAAADPANTGWQRDLSVSHSNLGDIVAAAGDLTGARNRYQASYEICLRLATADPTNTEWLRNLSISHNKLGDIATTAGDLTAARTAYQASLDIAVRLTAADPANTEWQRDLSVGHNKLGDVAMGAGDLTAARTAYQASLDIAVRLAAADSANAQWQRDLAFVRQRIAKLDEGEQESQAT